MKLKTLRNILSNINYPKSVLRKFKNYLLPGRYLIFNNLRSLSLDDKDVFAKASKYFARGSSNRNIIIARFLNYICYYRINSNSSTKQYEAIYIANNYDKVREIKLFSFQRKRILVICANSQDYTKQFNLYTILSPSYNLPPIYPTELSDSYETAMIELASRPHDRLALKEILQSHTNNATKEQRSHSLKVQELISFNYSHEINAVLDTIVTKIDKSLLSIDIPIISQHGDLSRDNLLYGNLGDTSGFWWIDWEHIDERIFLYDFFFYIVNSCMYYTDEAMKSYLNGELDKELETYFLNFGLEFNQNMKKDYLLIFMLVFLKERVCQYGYINVLNSYYKLIESYL